MLSEDRILPGLPKLFIELGTELPSAVAIVTGPSRSADIEQSLTIGVHGIGRYTWFSWRRGSVRCMEGAALVTGAASGIGRAIAARLRRDGMGVLAVDLRPDPDGPGEPFEADLASREGNRAAVDAAVERFGRLDAVVANAGFQHVAPVQEFPEAQWDALVALLLTSPFLLAKYAWEALTESGDGRFLVVASVHGLVASPFKAGYVAAKHGVVGLVKTLALEGADRGIVAAALCPAYVRTPLVENQVAAQAEAHGLPQERVLEEVILAPQAVRRLLEPDEVADVAAYLLGPGGRAFTGNPVVMDLGWTAR